MAEKLSKEKSETFDRIIKSFNLALMNSALYASSHPAFNASIEFFKTVLDKWLVAGEKLELGITPDNILLNGVFVKEDSDLYGSVAGYLHKKGLMTVCFKRGVSMDELLKLFAFLKKETKVSQEKDGISKYLGGMPNLIIKELDYSSFLTSADTSSAAGKNDIWRALSDISKGLKDEQLSAPADELFKNIPDDAMADFMASLMRNENNVTEKMIKLFNRLMPGQDKADRVLPLMADKLFQEKALSRDTLSALQNSIKDLFETHPDDSLIARIYDLTVEAFLDKDRAAEPALRRHLALVDEYKGFLKEDNLKKEKIKLLLNILWLENDAAKFKKTGDILAGSFLQMLEPGHIEITKKAFEFLVEKLSLARAHDDTIASTIKGILDRISEKEITDKLASFIPGAECATLDDIVYMLINAGRKTVMLEVIGKERNYDSKKKMLAALVGTKDAGVIRELFDKFGRQGFFKNRLSLDLVMLCGTFKAAESLECLKKILARRPFINTGASRELRVQAALTLGVIDTPEAMEIIRKFSGDPDSSLRAVCRLILESDETARKKAI